MKVPLHHKLLASLIMLALPLAPIIVQADEISAPAVAMAHQKVVFQISDDSIAKWNLTLTNAKNVQDAFGKNNVDVEIVAFGPGIDLLKFESELGDNINKAIDDGVHIVACENTMKSKHLVKADMLPNIGYVASGVVELIKRQREGWAYVRP